MNAKQFKVLRVKMAMFPGTYYRSKEARPLLARILRTVRRENGREAAKVIRQDILMYSVLP